jgi:deoxyadenosine/deoxycytidine kinase
MKVVFVHVDGNLAAGKTSLIEKLISYCEKLIKRCRVRPSVYVEDVTKNKYWSTYYTDKADVFGFQEQNLANKIDALRAFVEESQSQSQSQSKKGTHVMIVDRSARADVEVFCRYYCETAHKISKKQFGELQNKLALFERYCAEHQVQQLYWYVDVDVDECMARIRSRAQQRKQELGLTREFVAQIDSLHRTLMQHTPHERKENKRVDNVDNLPLLTLPVFA